MNGGRVRDLVIAAIAGGALACAAPAAATVTIGSNLQRPATASTACFPVCTVALNALDANLQGPGGILAPVNGTVTAWHITAGNKSGATAFRVIHPRGDGTFAGAGTSASVDPALDTTSSYPVQMPIQRGDMIGIDCC